MRIAYPTIAVMFLSACAANPPVNTVHLSGTLTEQNGDYFLQADTTSYQLSAMPQLQYREYLGRNLAVEGETSTLCAEKTTGAAVETGEPTCIAPQKISLQTQAGDQLVYDWQKIDLEDYFF